MTAVDMGPQGATAGDPLLPYRVRWLSLKLRRVLARADSIEDIAARSNAAAKAEAATKQAALEAGVEEPKRLGCLCRRRFRCRRCCLLLPRSFVLYAGSSYRVLVRVPRCYPQLPPRILVLSIFSHVEVESTRMRGVDDDAISWCMQQW